MCLCDSVYMFERQHLPHFGIQRLRVSLAECRREKIVSLDFSNDVTRSTGEIYLSGLDGQCRVWSALCAANFANMIVS